MKKKILEEEIHCPPEASVLLASYAVHAKVNTHFWAPLYLSVYHLDFTSGFITGSLIFTVQFARPGMNALFVCSFTYLWSYDFLIVFTCNKFLSDVVTPAYKLSDYCDWASHPIQAKMDSFLWITHLWNCEDEVRFHILYINLSWETLNVFFCCRWLLPIAQSRIFVSNHFLSRVHLLFSLPLIIKRNLAWLMLYFCWLFSELWPPTAFNRGFRLSSGPRLLKVTKTHTHTSSSRIHMLIMALSHKWLM